MSASERPEYAPTDPLMQLAWRDFISWAFDQPQIRQDFEQATGQRSLPPARTPLDLMVDDATGAHSAYAEAFIKWATEAMWDAPEPPFCEDGFS